MYYAGGATTYQNTCRLYFHDLKNYFDNFQKAAIHSTCVFTFSGINYTPKRKHRAHQGYYTLHMYILLILRLQPANRDLHEFSTDTSI